MLNYLTWKQSLWIGELNTGMGTHFQGKRREQRALDAYIKLHRAADTITAITGRRVKQLGLTYSQFGVLEMLLHLGPLQQSVISDKLLKSGGNITMVIDHLEELKFIRRQVNPNDRRCVVVHLTDAGRKMIEDIFPAHAAYIAELMNSLTSEEQDTLGELCRKLGHSAAQR